MEPAFRPVSVPQYVLLEDFGSAWLIVVGVVPLSKKHSAAGPHCSKPGRRLTIHRRATSQGMAARRMRLAERTAP